MKIATQLRIQVLFGLLFMSQASFATLTDQKQKMVADPLTAELLVDPGVIPAGSNTTLKLLLKLEPGHHAYADMFQVTTQDSTLYRIGRFSIAPLVDFSDPFTKRVRKVIENRATMSVPIDISSETQSARLKIVLELTYQACTKDFCLFPKTMMIPLDLRLAPANSAASTPKDLNERLNQAFKLALQQNLAWAFLIVFLAGFLTSLTPCIFPMIPITLTVLGTRQKISTFQRFKLSLSYVLGIALTYSTLGMIVASTGALFGAFLGSPPVIICLACVFVLMGFSMLGWFEIALPPKIHTFLSPKPGNAGTLEAILSGLLAGCIASPCVGPVLVSVLTFVAQTKSLFLGFWLLFVFAFGMGQLFLILGTSTRLADRLPRSGPWMIGIQKFFAICFFSLAAWYVSPLLSTALLYLVLALLMFAFCSVFGLFRKTRPQGVFQIMSRAMLAAGFLAAVYCSFRGATFFFNPAPQGSQQTSSFQWQTYSAETLANAVQNHRPVIVDFWADWCVACKELEYTTYSDTQIKTLSKDFVLLKFDATKSTPEFEKLKKTYGIMGLPFVGFYDSSGVLRPDLTLTGYEKAPLFLQRMRSAFQPNKAKDDLALPNH